MHTFKSKVCAYKPTICAPTSCVYFSFLFYFSFKTIRFVSNWRETICYVQSKIDKNPCSNESNS